jgi:hypothetical protein
VTGGTRYIKSGPRSRVAICKAASVSEAFNRGQAMEFESASLLPMSGQLPRAGKLTRSLPNVYGPSKLSPRDLPKHNRR